MTPIRRLLNIIQFDLAEKLNLARLRWYHLNHQDQYLQSVIYGNQILTCKVYKEPNYILSMSNEEILELISGLDYIGNLPTVPDLEKPIEIQVSTIRRIPLEQNKEVQTKIKEIIYNNLYDTLVEELKGTISRFQAQYNIQEINPYLQDILQNPEDLISRSNNKEYR